MNTASGDGVRAMQLEKELITVRARLLETERMLAGFNASDMRNDDPSNQSVRGRDKNNIFEKVCTYFCTQRTLPILVKTQVSLEDLMHHSNV